MPTTRRREKSLKRQEQLKKQKQSVEQVEKNSKREEKEESVQKDSETVEQQQKVKPKEKKPKKYKKKSVEQQARINRSKHQRIFLLTAVRGDSNWSFMVQGTKGSQYSVTVSTEVHCTCVDFRMKGKPCKHIYFIVTQVGQNDQLLDYFKNDDMISKKAYKLLDQQLQARLKSRLEKPTKEVKDIDLKDDKDCVICFSEMDKETEPLQDCSTCKKYFHAQCISAWKNHNPSCPLCRGSLMGGARNDADPLSKVIDIKI